MKCIKNPITGEVKRLDEAKAKRLVRDYAWAWASKQAWKDWKAKELTQAVRRRV